MELTGGQAAGSEPEGQLVGVVDRISIDSGVKVHDDTLGRPEQESVTNIGEVRAELSSGVMVTAIVPDSPGLRLSGNVEGATAASESAKFGVELVCPVALVKAEVEAVCVASPE